MSPSSFSFKLTVPNDPEGATIAAGIAVHAAEYATLDAAAGAAFAGRVRDAVNKALTPGGPACLVIFAAANGQLTVTIGKETAVSQPLQT